MSVLIIKKPAIYASMAQEGGCLGSESTRAGLKLTLLLSCGSMGKVTDPTPRIKTSELRLLVQLDQGRQC